jgi:hypothetical protein
MERPHAQVIDSTNGQCRDDSLHFFTPSTPLFPADRSGLHADPDAAARPWQSGYGTAYGLHATALGLQEFQRRVTDFDFFMACS